MIAASQQPIRIALYTRCATDRDGALEAQEASVRTAVAEMPAPHVIVRTFRDVPTSGLPFDRPGIRELLAAAAAREIDMVMVTSHDRLSRSYRDLARLRHVLAAHGVRITTPDEEREPAITAIARHVSTLSL